MALTEWQIQQAINEARNTLDAADRRVDGMARLINGRLKHVTPWVLAEMKKQLRDFNAHTGEWK